MKRRQESLKDFQKKINRFDSFTKVRSAVLGQVNWTLVDLIEDKDKRNYTQAFLEDLDETHSHALKILQDFGVVVDRPKPLPYDPNKKYVLPHFELPAIKNCVSPADPFLCLANTVVEVSSVQETSFLDFVQYRHIWQEYFDNGSSWIAPPIPTHDPAQWDGFDYYDWAEPLFDGPSVDPVGNIALIPEGVVLNKRAKLWLERQFPEFNFVKVKGTRGHLDSYFRILKPGLIYSAIPKEQFPDKFKNWDIIFTDKTQYTPPEIVSQFIQDDDYENTTLDVNGFSLDEENFILMRHMWEHHPEVVKQIESHGINCIPLPFDSSRFLNQGITCIINATYRDGKLEDYF